MIIKGFWHIYMINHWYSIVSNQMRILLTSGLYDACEAINIGCIGRPEERASLERYFIDVYPKLKIKYCSSHPDDFEFRTLQLIEADDSNYAGLYFHAKGVTKPTATDIAHWTAVLNEKIVNQWREHYQNILSGYDVSSVNFLKDPDHFSGNYWWFNRRYIDTLPKIDDLNHTNRWHAEQWICMRGDRKAYAKEFIEPGEDAFLMQQTTARKISVNQEEVFIVDVVDAPCDNNKISISVYCADKENGIFKVTNYGRI